MLLGNGGFQSFENHTSHLRSVALVCMGAGYGLRFLGGVGGILYCTLSLLCNIDQFRYAPVGIFRRVRQYIKRLIKTDKG